MRVGVRVGVTLGVLVEVPVGEGVGVAKFNVYESITEPVRVMNWKVISDSLASTSIAP